MKSLEQSLKELTAKITGKPLDTIPNELEPIIAFLAEHYPTPTTPE